MKINETENSSESNEIEQTTWRIGRLEDRNVEITQVEEEGELRFLKNERTLSELSDFIKKGNRSVSQRRRGRGEQKAHSEK